MLPVRTLSLRPLMTGPEGWGGAAGRRIHDALRIRIDAVPAPDVVRLALGGVNRIDVTFAAEALLALVKHYRGSRHLCVVDITSDEVRDNVAAAALLAGVPVTLWSGNMVQVSGPKLTRGLREALDHVLARTEVTTRWLASALGVTAPNASTRLKQLHDMGYLMRRQAMAPSGGPEFVYSRIG